MERAGVSMAAALAGVMAALSGFVVNQGIRSNAFPSTMEFPRKRRSWNGSKVAEEGNKFVPRFDGLKFIETLVTAHR